MNDAPNFQISRRAWLGREFRRVLAGNRRSLLNGLPALLVGGAVCVFASLVATIPEDQRLAPYVEGSALGAEPGKHDLALLCTERLIQEKEADPRPRYAYAMILRADGDLTGAESTLSELAPIDKRGYPPAHLALARLLLGREGQRDEPTMRTVERHLEHALDGPDVAEEASILLGRIYAATGRGDRAEPYLRAAADRHPELLLVLARLARERGDHVAAAADLDSVIRVFRTRAEAHLDDIDARLLWANAVSARSDFAGAVGILERGLARSPDPRYHLSLARTYADWAKSVTGKDSAAVGERLALLERGLVHAPNNLELLDQLAEIVQVGGAEVGRIRSILQAQLTDGNATATTHFLLGLDAFSSGRGDEARLHWEQAFRLAPNAPMVANNLAWLLAHAEPPDLVRALELAERAVERRPKQPHFRGTRGIVLMKLNRWSEALTDLEAALAGDPGSVETHVALSQVYDKLGSPELASQHRDRAAALKKQAAGQTPSAKGAPAGDKPAQPKGTGKG